MCSIRRRCVLDAVVLHLADVCPALVVYDCILTFDAEFSIFWRRRWNVSSVLYFVNRYVEIMSCVTTAVSLFPVQDQVSNSRL